MSTPMSEPKVLGRFGHHPDHIIDYSVEVECIEAMVTDFAIMGRAFHDDDRPATRDEVQRRIWRAEGFRVGVVPKALKARRLLIAAADRLALSPHTGASQ